MEIVISSFCSLQLQEAIVEEGGQEPILDLDQELLRIVSERTGYPEDMLDLDHNGPHPCAPGRHEQGALGKGLQIARDQVQRQRPPAAGQGP